MRGGREREDGETKKKVENRRERERNGQRVLTVIKKSSCVWRVCHWSNSIAIHDQQKSDNTKTSLLMFFVVVGHNQIWDQHTQMKQVLVAHNQLRDRHTQMNQVLLLCCSLRRLFTYDNSFALRLDWLVFGLAPQRWFFGRRSRLKRETNEKKKGRKASAAN